jgi:hypothetical protein
VSAWWRLVGSKAWRENESDVRLDRLSALARQAGLTTKGA